VSTSRCRGILAVARLLLERLIAERGGDSQSDCRDDREQPYASRSGKASGPKHEQDTRLTNAQLVQERIASDNDKCDSRGPEAQADEPCAHAPCR
jgi:hypothetical protein